MVNNPHTDDLVLMERSALHALRSYQYGNSSPDIAEQTANLLEDAINKFDAADLELTPRLEGKDARAP